ncbi:MAG: DUF547 domain-containing protein [Pseudomonadota bacterium]
MALTRRSFAKLTLAGVAASAALPAAAAPKSRLIDERWTRSGTGGDPDYGAWAKVLSAHVRPGAQGVNMVDYAALKASGEMDAIVAGMAAAQPTAMGRDAAMAYWINLYNAVTIQVVLEEYPVDSIRKVRGGLFNTGPWGDALVEVEGQPLSLDDIEHGILRPIWNDPRIHYGVNCASIGCPNLALAPYTAARLDGVLTEGAFAYVNDPRGAAPEEGGLVVSSIYEWFKEDFGDSDAGILAHLGQYAKGGLKEVLAGGPRIVDDRYDWAINAA